MKARLLITPAALRDLQQGIDYYNSRQRGLGKRFAKIIADTFSRIQKMPEAASFAYNTVRKRLLIPFRISFYM